MKPRHRAGFTLMELIFVVLIIGLIGAVGHAPVTAWVTRSRVDNATRVVASDLRFAVALATRQGAPVRIEFSPAGSGYLFRDRSDQVLFRRDGSDLPVGAVSALPSTITVFPNRQSSAPIAIRLRAGRYSSEVTMSSATFVQVRR
jgi:prepilin-type N-terminal cleavage/methylation domain-containing protein